MTMCVPALVAIRAASILVCMPPRDSSERRHAGHRLDFRRDTRDTRYVLRRHSRIGRGVVEAIDVRQKNQKIGADHGGDASREPVVVAVANFVGRYRIVLVDDRQGAPCQQRIDGGARVEITPPLLGIAKRHQHLTGDDAVARQRLGPGARQCDLPHRGGGLAVLELERTAGKLEHGAAERDSAGGHDQNVALVAMKFGEIRDQRASQDS